MTRDDLATAKRLAQDLLDRAKALRAFIAHERHDNLAEEMAEEIDEYNSSLVMARDAAYRLMDQADTLHQYLEAVP